MLDSKFIRENKALVKKNNQSRNVKIDLDDVLALDAEKNVLQQQIDTYRAKRNDGSKTKPTPAQIAEMKKIGEKIKQLEVEANKKEVALKEMLIKIPNLNHPTTPIGQDETKNKVEKQVGKKPTFAFAPKEHFEIARVKQYIDMERGAKVAGSRFYYLRGKLAILERAIMNYAIDTMVKNGFELVLPPLLVKENAMYGTGFFPAERNEVYTVNPGEDGLFLIGTSEVPLIYQHADEILDIKDAPKKYVAITPCFRREAGSYGKDTKGLFRVHQFYKVEMVIFCVPEVSWELHENLLQLEQQFLASVGLHYRIVNICSGDLGYPAAKKYDCEGWFPGQGRYRELTSTSNTTDYQARRSNIKYKTADGKKEFAHTLNSTVASDRPLLAILENNQQADGSVIIPEVLRAYTGFDTL